MSKKYLFLFLFLFLLPSISSANNLIIGGDNQNVVSILTGNLTAFLQLEDTPGSYAGSGGLCVKVNGGTTALEFGACGTGSGDSIDQGVNTTASPTFQNLTLGGEFINGINISNVSEGSHTTDTSASVDCSTDEVLLGNSSCISIATFSGDNSSWNESYADTLYAGIGAGADNSSWNESYARDLFAQNSTPGIQSLLNFTSMVFSSLFSLDWTNVTVLESQIIDLVHTVDSSAYVNCSGDQVLLGNGSCISSAVFGGVGGHTQLDQDVNTTANVTFLMINVTDWTNVTVTEGQISDLVHTTDTNESLRFGNLTTYDCGGTDKVVGVWENGTVKCGTDQLGAGGDGHVHDQSLNTTNNVTFENVNVTDTLTANTLVSMNNSDGGILWYFDTDRDWQLENRGTGAGSNLWLSQANSNKRFYIGRQGGIDNYTVRMQAQNTDGTDPVLTVRPISQVDGNKAIYIDENYNQTGLYIDSEATNYPGISIDMIRDNLTGLTTNGKIITSSNITADYFKGNGSLLTGIGGHTVDSSAYVNCSTDEVLLGNGSCISSSTLGGSGDNSSWNESYADTLYDPLGSVGNPFDQSLNTTDNVIHNQLSINSSLNDKIILNGSQADPSHTIILGNQKGLRLFDIVSNIGTFILSNTGNLNITGNLTVDGDYINGVKISNISEGPHTTDSSAYVNCSAGEYFDGDGICRDLNTTIDGRIVSVTYLPTQNSTTYGTESGGNNIGNLSYSDGQTYNITEANGPNALEVYINFTGVATTPDFITMGHQYDGTHYLELQIWDYNDLSWEVYDTILPQSSILKDSIALIDGENHVSGEIVQIRFIHPSNGISSDNLYIDFVNLVEGFSTVTTTEHDGLSGRNNLNNHMQYGTVDDRRSFTNITTTSNVTVGGLVNGINISNVSEGPHTTNTNTQKGTDGPYLYNDSSDIFFNDTHSNTTINLTIIATTTQAFIESLGFVIGGHTAFDQGLNTTANVTFLMINVSDWSNVSITSSQVSGIVHTTDTSASQDCSTDQVLLGNGSCQSSSIYLGTYNVTYHGLIDNASYLATYNVTYDGYATNVSINYTSLTFDTYNGVWVSTYNVTYDAYATNVSINWTSLTYDTYNDEWIATYNVSYAGSLNNASYLSTYNSTYDNYALNVSINYTTQTFNTYNATWSQTYNSTYAGHVEMDYTNLALINKTNVFAENQNFSKNITLTDSNLICLNAGCTRWIKSNSSGTFIQG